MSYNVVYEDIGRRDYKETWEYQTDIFNRILEQKRKKTDCSKEKGDQETGTMIFVEHPHVYTLGKSGSENNLLLDFIQLKAKDAMFYHIDRGGDITYHGPGQIVGYPIFDLEMIGIGLKEYVFRIEETIINTIGEYGLEGSRLEGSTGVWIDTETGGNARKICAIGIKASRFVTMHGFALNVNTDLSYFNYINPCGITDKGVTSLEKELKQKQDPEKVKQIISNNLEKIFDLNWINRTN